MARKRKPPEPRSQAEEPDVNATAGSKGRAADRHKHKRVARIPDDLAEAMDRLAERNDRPFPWEVRRAIVDYLRRHGFLPPGYSVADQEGQ